ncbi:MAG: YggS family pyridoxal phosphate-dependent enzyme [Proteobacteria bacterium]|nr:YggS family pyridoxal phosphate-dependent enzyme [Desulfobacula sp.]MBU3953540.1 YggS family pyridoxal phosphate-dependent enzyme [Pseudomonadota bacterium]MBU4129209.1 YggS family pyridoxal phosphate-dependent enzyme [Pseudomonadota bacterium]
MHISENIASIKIKIQETALACGRDPGTITLIGVSKRKSADTVLSGIKGGITHLGENYIQEAVDKINTLGKNQACWHFIGHLQSNKARFAVQYFDYIHTVDTAKLAREIDKQAAKIGKVQKILLQINIAKEETKFGASARESIVLARELNCFENLSLEGLMCMPPYFDDPENARIYFKRLGLIKEEIGAAGIKTLTHLSMGMSNDFRVAIEEGATMVRVGTAIFGSRD